MRRQREPYPFGLLSALAESDTKRVVGELAEVIITPEDSLSGAVSAVAPGGTVWLTPGRYWLVDPDSPQGYVTLSGENVRLVAPAGAHIVLPSNTLRVAGEGMVLDGLLIEQIEAATAIIRVDADFVALHGVVTVGDATYGVEVNSGDTVAVCGCRSRSSATGGSSSDIYFADAATYGIVACNQRSASRTYALNYKGTSNLTESANGPSGIINVR